MRKDVKCRNTPTTAKVRRYVLESYELLYGRVFTWGMKPLFTGRLSKKYLKAKRLSKLHKKGDGKE